MKSVIFVLIVLVVFATAKPYERTYEASVDVDYDYIYDRDTSYNLEFDDYFGYDVDRDFDVYEVEYDFAEPQYEIVRETDIEIDYTREEDRKQSSKTTIQA